MKIISNTSVDVALGERNYTAVRLGHQRDSFYAKGRQWMFYGEYRDGIFPCPLYYITSTDSGKNWSSRVYVTTFPWCDAEWSVCIDGDKVWVVCNIQNITGSCHDGLKGRRGTLNSDGTITWDADWQTIINTEYFVGDFSLAVDSQGRLLVGYGHRNFGDGSFVGDAYIIKNNNTDGTWSTASGFPKKITNTYDAWFPVVSKLNENGGFYIIIYKWFNTKPLIGWYSIDGSSDISTDGYITTNNCGIGYLGGAGALSGVAGIDSVYNDGELHFVYTDDEGNIRYGKRNYDGSFSDEETISSGISTDACPRISIGEDTYYVSFNDYNSDTITIATRENDGNWLNEQIITNVKLEPRHDHILSYELVESNKLGLTYLTDEYVITHIIVLLESAISLMGVKLFTETITDDTPLRINGNLGLTLQDTTDDKAGSIRIHTSQGTKSIKQL